MRNEIWEEKVKKKKWELNENEQAECHLQSSEYTASRHGNFPEQCQLKSFWKFHTQQQQQQQYRKKMLWQRALAQFHQIEFLLPYFSIHCVSRSPMMGMRAVRCLTHRQWIVINEYYILIIHDFNRCISKPTVWVLRNKKFQREIHSIYAFGTNVTHLGPAGVLRDFNHDHAICSWKKYSDLCYITRKCCLAICIE